MGHGTPLAPSHAVCQHCGRHQDVNRQTGVMNGHRPTRRSTTKCPGGGQHYTSKPLEMGDAA